MLRLTCNSKATLEFVETDSTTKKPRRKRKSSTAEQTTDATIAPASIAPAIGPVVPEASKVNEISYGMAYTSKKIRED